MRIKLQFKEITVKNFRSSKKRFKKSCKPKGKNASFYKKKDVTLREKQRANL